MPAISKASKDLSGIATKMLAINRSLDEAAIPHAFGGALALAWCTQRARGTIDIDLNVFVSADHTQEVLDALPREIVWSSADQELIQRDGQQRLWWESTPVDLFINTTEFHVQAGRRTRWELFEGVELPFLSCSDLAVFKAFFNRTKDWADLEEMLAANTLDIDRVIGVLVHYLGPTDERIERLERLRS